MRRNLDKSIGNPVAVGRWEVVEASFSIPAGEPAAVAVDWAHASGRTLRTEGFEDGEGVVRVRFAPILAGDWTGRVQGVKHEDLHVRASEWSEEERAERPLRHGFLKVSPQGRVLQHEDGTPFFWLGDTLWAGAWGGCDLEDAFERYVQNRAERGFSVVQIVAGYPTLRTSPNGWGAFRGDGSRASAANDGGDPYLPDGRVNPAFYKEFDKKVERLLEAGMVPCLLGMWGQELEAFGTERAIEHWRMLIRRYGAYPVIWCIAGEYYFTPDEQAWRKIGEAVDAMDPFGHPTTIHSTAPHSGSRHFHGDAWCDFHLSQLGHSRAGLPLLETLAREDYRQHSPKPSIQGESCYEAHMDTLGDRASRFDDWEIRVCSWVPLLCGNAGQTYGAQGIWSWAQEEDRTSPEFNAPAPWFEELERPVAAQQRHLADFFRSLRWWELVPAPARASTTLDARVWTAEVPSSETRRPTRMPSAETIVAYGVGESGWLIVWAAHQEYDVRWFDPATGAYRPVQIERWTPYGDFWKLEARLTGARDWVIRLDELPYQPTGTETP